MRKLNNVDRRATVTNNSNITLCNADELIEGNSKGFMPGDQADTQSIFLVRKNGTVYGYKNDCPHTGAPLEWMPDQFLSLDGEQIQCALHGARFNIENGLCVSGPCVGASLTPIELEITDTQIIWQLPPKPRSPRS